MRSDVYVCFDDCISVLCKALRATAVMESGSNIHYPCETAGHIMLSSSSPQFIITVYKISGIINLDIKVSVGENIIVEYNGNIRGLRALYDQDGQADNIVSVIIESDSHKQGSICIDCLNDWPTISIGA